MRTELRRLVRTVGISMIVLPVVATASAQEVPTLSASARVSLISILPGDDLYSTFGHSAIRVADPALGIDKSYNYGTFDFGDSPAEIASFIGRFAYGDLNYRLSVEPARRTIAFYWEVLGRATVEQTLALSPGEKQALFRYLSINALPENSYYQYDFFFDNCATRLLDVIEASVGPALSFDAPPTRRSFRELLDPYLPGVPWTDFGMDLGLGLPADREATPREATFLPELLLEYVATGQIERDGRTQPLVARTDTLTGGGDISWAPVADPPWPSIVLWILFALGTLLTVVDVKARRGRRRFLDATFFGVLGIAGLVVVFLWFVSLHSVTDGNLNLAWALPTHLIAALAIARDRGLRWLGAYMALTVFGVVVLLVGFPFWPQQLPSALVPLLLLIGVRAGALVRVRLNPPG
ncbi:MAG: DUF4105 domain-containing protein [Gemmatimonadota bacterium]|nr:DUF4105 domain-containing protein [Gemmatimonadota bacterium]MDH3427034.1 DUF4105 domain-containing protein [Gemmatimonadota bacterium]